MEQLLIKEIMAINPVTININRHFSEVEQILRNHHIRHLPVVDDNNILRGIITQRDLYKLCAPRKTIDADLVYDKQELDKFILRYVMTPNPLTLTAQDTIEKAIDLMVSTKYGCIPIVDEQRKIIGILTQIDILRAVHKYWVKDIRENN
ncbi:MAG: CBS domain-containing protein [Candidatus Omnitrophica bacterium]|jgi:acetoin utilization protein AcuB|nr:CBS domain-containing protein [Candidatus Omnitrophota bacterium]